LLASVEKTGRVVIVHEAVKTGGVGAELIARINERAILSLEAPVVRVTGYDTPYRFRPWRMIGCPLSGGSARPSIKCSISDKVHLRNRRPVGSNR